MQHCLTCAFIYDAVYRVIMQALHEKTFLEELQSSQIAVSARHYVLNGVEGATFYFGTATSAEQVQRILIRAGFEVSVVRQP